MGFCISGCFNTKNPFANVDKLGTVIRPDKSITIQSSMNPIVVEFVSPTERRIVLNGQSREFKLSKSIHYCGIFGSGKFKQGPIGNVHGVSYGERTITFRSEMELKKFIQDESYRLTHVEGDELLVGIYDTKVSGTFTTGRKAIGITIYKYEIKENDPPPWGYLYPAFRQGTLFKNQVNTKNDPNKRVDPTRKTPGDSVND